MFKPSEESETLLASIQQIRMYLGVNFSWCVVTTRGGKWIFQSGTAKKVEIHPFFLLK